MWGVRNYVYVFFTTVVLFCGVAAEHSFVVQPADTVAIEGTSVQLQCKVVVNITIGKDITYYMHWQFNNNPFIEKHHDGYDIEEDRTSDEEKFNFTSNLTISPANQTNSGLYRCLLYGNGVAVNPPSENANVVIIPSPEPSFLREPQNDTAIEGRRSVKLRCRIEYKDANTMSVKWTKDNQVISDDQVIRENATYNRSSIIGDNVETFHLQIEYVQRSDAGTYSCRVYHKTSNTVILRSQDVALHVIYAPDDIYPICSPTKAANYSAGETLTTDCVSKGGNGPMNLTWLRNGEEIIETPTSAVVTHYNVSIRNTWKLTPDDNGANITCVLKGEAISNQQRQCVIGPLNVYFEPTVSIQPKMIQVFAGQHATFTCSVRANPPTGKYIWLLNESQLNNSGSIVIIRWDDIAKHVTSAKPQVNVTCGPEGDKTVSASAIVNVIVPTETTRPPKSTDTTGPPKSKSVVSPVIIYIVVGCLLLAIVGITCVVLLYLKRKRNPGRQKSITKSSSDVSYALTSVTIPDDEQRSPLCNDYDICKPPTVAAVSQSGNASGTQHESEQDRNSSPTYAQIDKKKKREQRASNEVVSNSIEGDSLGGETSLKRHKNVEGLVYADLDHHDSKGGNASNQKVKRRESPVTYADLMPRNT